MIQPSFLVLRNENDIKEGAAPVFSASNFQDCMVGFMECLYSGEYNNYTSTYYYNSFPTGEGRETEWRIYSPFDIKEGIMKESVIEKVPALVKEFPHIEQLLLQMTTIRSYVDENGRDEMRDSELAAYLSDMHSEESVWKGYEAIKKVMDDLREYSKY